MKLTLGKWTALVAAVCAVAAAMAASIAIAGAAKPVPKRPATHQQLSVAAFKKFLRNPAERIIGASTIRAATKKRGKFIESTSVSLEGGFAYLTITRIPRSLYDDESPEPIFAGAGFTTKVVRVELATGSRSTIYEVKNAFATVLAADDRAWIIAYETSGSRRIRINATLSTATTSELAATQVSASSLTAAIDGKIVICGSLAVPLGLTDTDEAVIGQISANCGGLESIGVELRALNPAGTTRTLLASLPLSTIFAADELKVVDDRMLVVEVNDAQSQLLSLPSGTRTPLWSGVNRSIADIASDGTVVLVGGDYDYETGERDGPMVVFPEGDADRIEVRSKSSPHTERLEFCGDRLYEFREVPTRSRFEPPANTPVPPPATTAGLHSSHYSPPARPKVKVIVRNTGAGFIKVGGPVPRRNIEAVGCDGNVLMIATLVRNRPVISRYGP